MDNYRWAQLHQHCQYSLLDGIIKRKDLIIKCKELGFGAVSITEHGAMYDIVNFYLDCKKEEIKPIIGIEAYAIPPIGNVRYNDHILLIAKNRVGYDNLLKLTSISFETGYYMGRGRITYDQLLEHRDGVIVSTACLAGRIHRFIADDNIPAARYFLEHMKNIHGDEGFFIELIDNGWSMQKMHNKIAIDLAKELDIPMIATNDVHYLVREDAYMQDVALAIQVKKPVSDLTRGLSIYENGNPVTDGYLKTLEEMKQLGFPLEAYTNVGHIIDMIEDYNIELPDKPMMPQYPYQILNFHTPREMIEKICMDNWERIPKDREMYYANRFDFEINIIEKLGFLEYFLIIWDIVDYCKRNSILTGPGRGSASGSIVVYLLGITEVDPIKYGLYFERFLNPERISPPDIDFDVEQGKRQEVIQYVKDKYGDNNVIQIGTFNRMAVKDTIKRIGKALGIDFATVQNVTKEINIDDGTKNHDMSEVLEKHPSVKNQMGALHPAWWRYCEGLCNLPTSIGVHAAGLIITDMGLSEVPSCFAGEKTEGHKKVSQFDMLLLEKMGYTKFDLLGLKSLDVIHETVKLINEIEPIFKDERAIYDEACIPLDDKKTYKLIGDGITTGVFQLEQEGFKAICRRLQPDNFSHIAALNALYRPGPIGSGMMDSFIERRHGREPVSLQFPEMEEITRREFGVPLYQEHLMRMAVEIAGYTLPQADHLRKIIGKKQVEKIEEEGKTFVDRGIKFGRYVEDQLNVAWDIIKPAGRYSWNAAHAYAYGYITYIMAYLKAHYAPQFFVASLNVSLGDSNRMSILIRDARDFGLEVLPPSVNLSTINFRAVDNKIVYGLQSIKGVGDSVAKAIIDNRTKDGPFEGLIDFITRVPAKDANSMHKKALCLAGAFDGIDIDVKYNRATIYEAITKISEKRKGKKYARATIEKGLVNCINNGEEIMKREYQDAMERGPDTKGKFTLYQPINENDIEILSEWSNVEIYKTEMEALGTSLSVKITSMFDEVMRWINIPDYMSIDQAKQRAVGWKVVISGMVTRVHKIITKTGKNMGFIELSDDSNRVDITVFPETWESNTPEKDSSYILFCRIDLDKDGKEQQFICDRIISLNEIKVSYLKLEPSNKYNISRLIEFSKFNHFEVVGHSSIVPKVGATYFMLTPHIGHFLDIFCGEGQWKAELV
jgi:DNA polymerase III subunit alpha